MTFTQVGLWDLLDAVGVPFRQTHAQLIATYGTHPSGWSDFVRYCPVPGGMQIIPDLAAPLAVQVGDKDIASHPAGPFVGYVRWSRWAGRNHARTINAIAAHFGAGRDVSVANTVSTQWGDAYCNITATVFPPRLNRSQGRNDRHRLIPGSATECSITIRPDWFPAVGPQHLSLLASWEVYAHLPPAKTGSQIGEVWPPLPDAHHDLPAGYGFAADDAAIIAVSVDRRMLIVPCHRITRVAHDVLTPAKGGGGSFVALRYATGDQTGAPTRSLTLLTGAYDDASHRPFARALADRVGVTLATHEQLDC